MAGAHRRVGFRAALSQRLLVDLPEVHPAPGLGQQGARGLEVHLHREQQPGHGRQGADRLAELDALARVRVGLAVGGLGDAEGLRGHGQARAVHQVHGVAHEPEAALAEQDGRRVVVLDLARRRGVDPQLVLDAPDLDRVVALDQEHREAAGVGRAFLAAGQDQRHVRHAVGDEALDAVEVPLAGGLVQAWPASPRRPGPSRHPPRSGPSPRTPRRARSGAGRGPSSPDRRTPRSTRRSPGGRRRS